VRRLEGCQKKFEMMRAEDRGSCGGPSADRESACSTYWLLGSLVASECDLGLEGRVEACTCGWPHTPSSTAWRCSTP